MRTPDGERVLEPGDVVHFPEGEPGTHQFRNDTAEPVRVLLGSSKGTLYLAGYPDSGKLNVSWPGSRGRWSATVRSSTTGTASSAGEGYDCNQVEAWLLVRSASRRLKRRACERSAVRQTTLSIDPASRARRRDHALAGSA